MAIREAVTVVMITIAVMWGALHLVTQPSGGLNADHVTSQTFD